TRCSSWQPRPWASCRRHTASMQKHARRPGYNTDRGTIMERTLAIIKPDAFERNLAGKILEHLTNEGFRIIALRSMRLTKKQAEAFYDVHRGKPFFDGLVEYMMSGTLVPVALERENAVAHLRKVIGATNFEEAEEGTIRKLYAQSLRRNSIH